MKKLSMKILVILMMFITSITTISSAPASVTFQRRDLQGVNIQTGATTYYKTVRTGNDTLVGYCLNKSLNVPSSGTTINYKQEVTTPGLVYIMQNGHGGVWNTSLLGSDLTNDQRYYATQLAIWINQGKLDANTLNRSDKAVAAAIKLADAAKNARIENHSISMSNINTEMTKEGNYYRSQLITVTGSGYENYTVSLSNAGSNAEIVTEGGQVHRSGASLPAGTKFYVRVLATSVTSTMTPVITVQASVRDMKVQQYTTNNSNYQDIGILMPVTRVVSNQKNLLIRYEQRSSVTIHKVDASTGRELAGARLQLADSNGTVIETWTSTTTPKTITNLPAGRYTVTELSAPDGYELNRTPINITLLAGETKTYTVNNVPKTYGVSILKVDSATGQPLAGATLVVKDLNGRVIDTWVSTTQPHSLRNLAPGAYTITETNAPAGYVLYPHPIHFTITNNSDSSRVISVQNSPEDKTTLIQISKRDATTNRELPGAHLTLKDSNGNVVESWISSTSPKTFTNLAPGKYTLIETQAPDGYGLSDDVLEFTIDADGNPDVALIMYNSTIPKTADMNHMMLYLAFAGTIALGAFGMYKLARQQ